MQILVWLTKTKTGDLDELNLTNYNAPLFAQIQHPGDARVGSRFAGVDFWNLARKRQEEADILVTNHAYLANHYMDTIWGQNPYLVIDEAHEAQFNDDVQMNLLLKKIDPKILELIQLINELQKQLYFQRDNAVNRTVLANDNLELSFQGKSLFGGNSKFKAILPKFQQK